MKKCTKCNKDKSFDSFGNDSKSVDGYNYQCKACCREYQSKYSKTVKGLIQLIYSRQKHTSKLRGHIAPNYTLNELYEWFGEQDNFAELYFNWKNSGYEKIMIPSCDRLDDYKPYSFDNLRLVTWRENQKKSHTDRLYGINNKRSKEVAQLTKKGELVNVFHSEAEAGRMTAAFQENISRCCTGVYKTTAGYRWMYTIASGIIPSHNRGCK